MKSTLPAPVLGNQLETTEILFTYERTLREILSLDYPLFNKMPRNCESSRHRQVISGPR